MNKQEQLFCNGVANDESELSLIERRTYDNNTPFLTGAKRNTTLKKDFGIYATPEWIVDLMVELISEDIRHTPDCCILEPACGAGQFLSGIRRSLPAFFNKSKKLGIEINKDFYNHLLNDDRTKATAIIDADFLLWKSDHLFNLIIGNPPYGIPSLSDHYTIKVDNKTKQQYKCLFATWHGKYNVYGAFVEKSVNLLKDSGQLLFIVPATFILLDEFKKLREFLACKGQTSIIYMGPEVFKPEADVASVILNFKKSLKNTHCISVSEYCGGHIKHLFTQNNWCGEIITFSTPFSANIDEACLYRIDDVFDVRISPRTPEIKKNKDICREEQTDCLPVLNGRNLKQSGILYESKTGFWIQRGKITKMRGFFSKPRIVVGLGFRGKGQVVADYDEKCYPWMGDIYHLIKKSSFISADYDLSERDVAAYLSSDIISRYVKDIYREVTYHLSATQIKNLPLPTIAGLEKIKREIR